MYQISKKKKRFVPLPTKISYQLTSFFNRD